MSTQPFRILITPLNWGLGHATRCLPIASAFAKTSAEKEDKAREVEIHWASDGQALALLKAELPTNTFIHELPSYGIRYPTGSASVNMVLGGPQMGAAIVREAKAVAQLHKRFNYNFILSDNRFGCRVNGVPSAIVTHQVHLPIRNWFSRKLGTMLNHRLLAKFDQVVVPDFPKQPRLAGKMSNPHPRVLTNFIGPISRFSPQATQIKNKSIAMAMVLSGPEPQRTKLENQLLLALKTTQFENPITLVRGRPDNAPKVSKDLLQQIEDAGNQLTCYDFMKTADLLEVLAEAEIILTRPGYTTVMDLSVLARKAIYVPTPGQPEQEWLGKALETKGVGICVAQRKLVLAEAISRWKELRENKASALVEGNKLLHNWVDTIVRKTNSQDIK